MRWVDTRWSLTVTTEPAEEPVTVDELRNHLRELSEYESSTVLPQAIKRARRNLEAASNRTFVSTVYALKFRQFPCDEIRIPTGPVSAIGSIQYVDTSGVSQTWSASDYDADLNSLVARIEPGFGEAWPTARNELNAVTVALTAGYGDAEDVPDSIKGAVLELAAAYVRNREPWPGKHQLVTEALSLMADEAVPMVA